jgi:ring-1,2-phenylacetyl-CoA epoxidase subunit PaaE
MQSYLQQYFTGVFGALAIMSIAYLIFWFLFSKKLANRKIQLSKRAGWPQIKEEILATVISFAGSTAFTILLLTLKDSGTAKFYTETGKYGIGYEVLTVVVMLIAGDAWFYWCHRAMHHPSIYKYVHALHHKSLDVNPYTSTSFHMIEAVVLTMYILPLALVMPISMAAIGVMQVLGSLNNLKSHLGYEFFPGFFTKAPFTILVSATNHSLHHTQYNGNYGLFFRFWDVVCGTELPTTTPTFTEIHQRQNEQIIDNTTYRTLTISNLVKENENTVSVYFTPDEALFYQYKAGQYLTIKVKIGNKTLTRCFSLSSTPGKDNFLRITIKLNGAVTNYFYNNAQIGHTIQALLPVGDFTFTPNPTAKNNYVLIAGGSGITPLYSMLQQMLLHEAGSTVTLLYANSQAQNIIFNSQLQQLAQQYPNFNYQTFISGQSRIGAANLQNLTNATFYICGPNSLKAGINATLKQLGVPKAKINTEHYADGYVPWFGLF